MSKRHAGSRSAYLGALIAGHMAEIGHAPHPLKISIIVDDMQRATRSAKAWGERACNEPMTEAQDAAGARRIDLATLRINDALISLYDGHSAAPTVDLGGDPRGPCGRLHIPGHRGDGWGEGFAIYQEGAR